ncbi:MAG TPA: nitronate monooxygenase [Burkholderiales bacterium]|nr:nitronate monooxygenase [Burkholderiales bacterium]
MTIHTALTRVFDIDHPIVLGPMGGVSGGRLAAAVSNAGGLGLVGGGYGDAEWLKRELALVKDATDKPWGAGLITWSASLDLVNLILGFKPHAFMLSFGDAGPYVDPIKRAGCKLILQIQTVEAAKTARALGADIIVAQGADGGGHGADRATLPLVPAVVDVAGDIPVVAAGGIADGRGLAAALMLGAQGALLGTRFYASPEALGDDEAKRRLATASGDDTRRTTVFDVVRGYDWPRPFTGRALNNAFMTRWHGREAALAERVADERTAFQRAAERADYETKMVWASEAVDLIAGVEGAADQVQRIALEAERLLRAAPTLIH